MRTNERARTQKINRATGVNVADNKRSIIATPKSPTRKRSTRQSEPTALLSEHLIAAECLVTFAYFNPQAKNVQLAGSFNGWAVDGASLARSDDGRWTATLILKPGTYEYRLIVDGVWEEDPMSARFAANPFGGLNSVVVVKG